ncbi:DMT family transporter [Sneathiella chinensis]|uniref:EamA domain-containing protein n=1 Tax=Sneathiella chinensis TaxID=349750 RepID=A0ABQ5U262_9PROT|nr:DMT family transporter [Sneathiella chinensis]GLQ05343.1 hypothetical protein GCM10007924_05640 [Sneathiella chinensis]
MVETRQNTLIGFICASTIVCLWSGWIVTTRSGATSALTAYDLAAMRFGISGLLALPLVLYFKPWRGMTLKRVLVVSQLAGIPYNLIVFTAFTLSPASHGGVFMNGILPMITVLLGWVWLKQVPHRMQLAGSALILVGASLTLLGGGSGATTAETLTGDLLFMLAGLFFAMYMIATRLWGVTSMQVLFCASVVNGVLYLPVWAVALPSGLTEASWSEIGLQALYQGVLATLFGMVLVAAAVRHIGAPVTAAMMSGVPAIAALLGIRLLGEPMTTAGWISILVLTPGIILTATFNRDTRSAPPPVQAKKSPGEPGLEDKIT